MCVPEVLTFIRCLRNMCFKFTKTPTIFDIIVQMGIESLHTIGLSLLIFIVLPELDSVRGAMILSATAVLPSLLNAVMAPDSEDGQNSTFGKTVYHRVVKYLLGISLILTSLRWWENFVTCSTLPCLGTLYDLKERLQKCRYKCYVLISVWKCVLSLFCMILSGGSKCRVKVLFDLNNPFSQLQNITMEVGMPTASRNHYTQSVVLLCVSLVLCSWLCYMMARFACKVGMDRFGYAVPVASVIPTAIVVIIGLCETKRNRSCAFAYWLNDKLFWNCDFKGIFSGLVIERAGWGWIFWFTSYLWTVSHLFTQKSGRLNRTDTLFVMPMYLGCLVDQSLGLNRRRQNVTKVKPQCRTIKDLVDDDLDDDDLSDISTAGSMSSLSMYNCNADTITKIHICATMWHETPTEMTQVLKSIMRMDEDQSARKNAQKYLKVVDRDYYELEIHIMFDDAWEYDENLQCRVPNQYVRQFMTVIDEAASAVHKVKMKLKPALKFDVPYGGRLVWTLPGDNRLFVHLKDKEKIRHKKRWSQVMYMYYLLGFRIMEQITDITRKQYLADNTFLLTIDGDAKFSPAAVQMLVDLMKKHSRLGSACGRIHPVGRGIIVWYQKFEYAIAHWFQKATEHVFGCVLCSPGCFALFRASALMDDNVIKKYTKMPIEPRHFVQYDQGEDRWLSTLLLKQGYRIEYAAASDAKTYAPEGFNEFFNQRRRWTPSSIANTLDLLSDYKVQRVMSCIVSYGSQGKDDMLLHDVHSICRPILQFALLLLCSTIPAILIFAVPSLADCLIFIINGHGYRGSF
ncbi:unnamed protein product [Soboliphyme baturini]|uniref:chitin synthase n=1 Tax=Soboliphyme baturini TaxID=241478 RepID=A0A183IN65_9BILA|nr:unnamed protein product [Soboliphyme baturini]